MNYKCPQCNGWAFQDGTEDADWNICECAKTFCTDCGVETKPGEGSARCKKCWDSRFGDD